MVSESEILSAGAVMGSYKDLMSGELARQKDSVLYDALVLHGVEAPIHTESLKGRLAVQPMWNHRELLSDGELYFLDGKPIARFHRLETKMDGNMMRCSRPYAIYPP